MTTFLDFVQMLMWSFVYVYAVVAGFTYKTYCIPALSICINFAWEFWSVVIRVNNGQAWTFGFFISAIWLLLDIGVVVTMVKYYTPMRRGGVPGWSVPVIGVTLMASAMSFLLFNAELLAPIAFADNALMSALFLRKRFLNENRWRTSYIVAICKLIGTLCATIVTGLMSRQILISVLGTICLFLDILYIFTIREIRENEQKLEM